MEDLYVFMALNNLEIKQETVNAHGNTVLVLYQNGERVWDQTQGGLLSSVLGEYHGF